MSKLIINELGPIRQCELECPKFMTLTGFQASGKSTIAKAIYYFRTMKEDIVQIVQARAFRFVPVDGIGDFSIRRDISLRESLEEFFREKFAWTFGSLKGMSDEMRMEYYFTETCFVKVSLKKEAKKSFTINDIIITFSDVLVNFFQEKNKCYTAVSWGIPETELRELKDELSRLFEDNCSVVYIPAGRSMITLLSQQFSYIYATMDDMQKRSLDCCTKDYLERILRIKPEFSEGLQGLADRMENKMNISPEIMEQASILIKKILRGNYRYNNGEEQIDLENGEYVKINFSSSGQQECVWILNLLYFYLLQQKQILFIIEEPESHLFPESQKYITELISLVSNCGHSVVLTTHSPYVLGTLNNLLYAKNIIEKHPCEVDGIISKSFVLDHKIFNAWFVKEGGVENCMDSEIHMIQNERIDEISQIINDEFDALLDLQNDKEGAVI